MTSSNGFHRILSALAEETTPFVLQVQAYLVLVRSGRDRSGEPNGFGAGFIWRSDGLILTNNHVVGQSAPWIVLAGDREYESRIVARAPEIDLALLQIAAQGLPAVRLADSQHVRIGELVYAFGHPWGQRNFVTSGIVSAVTQAQTRGRRGSLPILRTDAPLAPGNSGGPLVNAWGEVIGINTMIVGGDQCVAIPAQVAIDFVSQALSGNLKNRRAPESRLREAVL